MNHLGSVTEVNGAEIEAVDVITFGSPCQDLSVAGKRAGLKHSANGDDETTRSGLFMEAVRIIKEMRRATNGEYPKYAIWENVMGAFSSNAGEDFRVVLEEFIKICEPEAPPVPSPGKAGWPYADCIVGDGWSLAWRVFDAQYWGVPQRRRRVYALLDLTGESAEKVLFEREGVRGYFAESGTPWERAASDAEEGIGAADSGVIALDLYNNAISGAVTTTLTTSTGISSPHLAIPYTKPIAVATQQGGAEISENGICPTVTAAAGMSGNNQPWICCENAAYGVTTKGNGDAFVSEERHTALSAGGGQAGQGYPCVIQPTVIIDNIGGQAEYGKESTVNGTLRSGAQGAICYGISSYDSKAMKSDNPHSGIYEAKTSRTIDLNGGNPACNQGGIAVVEPVCYDARGNGAGNIAPTITGDHNNRVTDYTSVVCESIPGHDQETHSVVYAVDQGGGKSGANTYTETAPTLTCTHGGEPAVAYATDVGFFNTLEDQSPTLLARGYKDPHLVTYQENQYIVRRLTPTECARLQGFPDRWGDIPQKDTFTDEEYSFWLKVRNTHAALNGRATKDYTKEQMLRWYNKLHSDSSEYKMWGNGIALPNALYVLQGIAEVIANEI